MNTFRRTKNKKVDDFRDFMTEAVNMQNSLCVFEYVQEWYILPPHHYFKSIYLVSSL